MKQLKWTLAALCVSLLAGCGSSEDKAEKLVDSMGLDQQYKMIVELSTAGYATQYPGVDRKKIKAVIEDNLSRDTLRDAMVEVYANHFDEDELDLIIQANKQPERAMAIILGSKDGQALARKTVEVQKDLMADMQDAMSESEEDIVDALDELQEEARG
ncbi:hypothetical protein A7D27_25820 [Pseudomonas sp. 1D4]|uniref:DUF2059 domain-containing protein n=1 Tax=Pseudomonadaceae TaxID=135621 RepID=UPI00084B64D0|nr:MULTISPECIES: hypothetical protein [Pseudomonas]OEC37031.1 hypothetical protein A7D27_25820 [Pseudomonas sp. 1D4]